ncbi:hypothetical protein O4H49_12875 [Kiloniella laminariae]|uniref:Transposase n=1 Tax=Kiloniella laminariae TaxID=454162 RepID=A0ABT4LKR1_9PROT|nr:hypothetical protein [Kiloniella laminariae]MCZ4281676.1 hypothetical protein [Kiloniella laminariae]
MKPLSPILLSALESVTLLEKRLSETTQKPARHKSTREVNNASL